MIIEGLSHKINGAEFIRKILQCDTFAQCR